MSAPGGTRERALVLTGFGAALRRSELVALDLGDVTVTETGLKVLVRFSKTDPVGAGEEVGIHRSGDPRLCPVKALEAWLALRGTGAGALFLQIVRGGSIRPLRLSDRGVARVVKAAAIGAGLDPALYSGHSLRAGLATSASSRERPVAAGIPPIWRSLIRCSARRPWPEQIPLCLSTEIPTACSPTASGRLNGSCSTPTCAKPRMKSRQPGHHRSWPASASGGPGR